MIFQLFNPNVIFILGFDVNERRGWNAADYERLAQNHIDYCQARRMQDAPPAVQGRFHHTGRRLIREYHATRNSMRWHYFAGGEPVHTGLSMRVEGPVFASDSQGGLCVFEAITSFRDRIPSTSGPGVFDDYYGIIYASMVNPGYTTDPLIRLPSTWGKYLDFPTPQIRTDFIPTVTCATPPRDIVAAAVQAAELGDFQQLIPIIPPSNTPRSTRPSIGRVRYPVARRLFD